MTKKELNTAIAVELFGWQEFPYLMPEYLTDHPDGKCIVPSGYPVHVKYIQSPPDFCNHRGLASSVEQKVFEMGLIEQYSEELCRTCNIELWRDAYDRFHARVVDLGDVILAKPAWRCQAAIIVVRAKKAAG